VAENNTPNTLLEEEDTSNINLWEQILTKASRSVADRVDSTNAIFLGNRLSGKSSLLARLEDADVSELKKGIALDYSFIEIFANEEDDDTISRMNLWQVEGEVEYSGLLNFALGKNVIGRSIAVIVLDFSQPWNLVQDLNKWLKVLTTHIESVQKDISPGVLDDLRNNQIYDFMSYNEAAVQTEENKTYRKHRKTQEEFNNATLPENVLSNNLGIPVLVVGTRQI